jgi:3'-5' exonuclease
MNIILDIETVPAQRPDVLAEIKQSKQVELDQALADIKPPGTYKKPETIAQWMADEAPKIAQGLRDAFESDVDQAYRKTGLDGAFGQLCVIGFAINDDEPLTIADMDESGLLSTFSALLGKLVKQSDLYTACVIGHNVSAFDLRFLAQRSIINGIKPHQVITRAAQAKPWESDKVFDTMVQWSGIGNRISLDKLCKALGIESPKGDITGATVWDAVKAGRLSDVATYCAGDVKATREVWRRMTYQAKAA